MALQTRDWCGGHETERELVELLVDTGAVEHVCAPQEFTHAALTSGPRPAHDRDW